MIILAEITSFIVYTNIRLTHNMVKKRIINNKFYYYFASVLIGVFYIQEENLISIHFYDTKSKYTLFLHK